MRLRRVLHALALTVSIWLVAALPSAAQAAVLAQKEAPPLNEDLRAASPWTYWMAWGVGILGLIVVIATALGYAVKGREFKANQRRGGSK